MHEKSERQDSHSSEGSVPSYHSSDDPHSAIRSPQASSAHFLPGNHPPTPDSLSTTRDTRKRDSAHLDHFEQPEAAAGQTSWRSHRRHQSGDSTASQVCICQPDRKVPRPRNCLSPLPLSSITSKIFHKKDIVGLLSL